ncbi:hypothetical protein F5Y08DRAFT_63052 [Xylaria arbuscula]|nr:hypothetical protein F5Y08DRAFT_63052 [Xylaria arbuscula]
MAATVAVPSFVSTTTTTSESVWLPTLGCATRALPWIELDLKTRLDLISRQWLLQRRHIPDRSCQRRVVIHKPLTIPDPAPKRSKRLPAPCDAEPSEYNDTAGFILTEKHAQRRLPHLSEAEGYPVPPSASSQRRPQREDALFSPLIPNFYCDLYSEDGFVQHAKKKKGKGAAAPPPPPPAPEKKDDGGAGDGGNGAGDPSDNAGDAGGDGAGKGDGDDKKDDKKDDKGDAGLDDDAGWGAFTSAGKKKKKGKLEETTDLLGGDTKFDAFDDIKLNDTGPSLDLNFGSSATDAKANPFSRKRIVF